MAGLTVEETKREYFKVFAGLMVLTAVTIGAAMVHPFKSLGGLGDWMQILLGILIAAVKVAMVIWIFMHIKFDSKYLRIMIFVPIFLLFVMVFALNVLESWQ